MTDNIIKVLIADDHDLIRQGLRTILNHEKDITVTGEAKNGEEVIAFVKTYKPHVLLMDINMPYLTGIEVLKKIKEEKIPVKVLLLTVESDRKTLMEAIEIGADGYILKDSDTIDIIDGIRRVYANENYIDKSLVSLLFKKVVVKENNDNQLEYLTDRELEILHYIAKGFSNKEISDELYLSEKTVKNYATKVFKKIDVKDRVHATLYAIENKVSDRYSKMKGL